MHNARIAILASGSGSNAENIHHYFQQRKGMEIVLIVSNRAEAYVHVRAKEMGVPSLTLNKESLQEAGLLLNLMRSFCILLFSFLKMYS